MLAVLQPKILNIREDECILVPEMSDKNFIFLQIKSKILR